MLSDPAFIRTQLLLGAAKTATLQDSHVAVFGIGGVGGACAEALARSGIGAMDLFDNDIVTPSNINRQIVALHSTIGTFKTDVMAGRIRDINPECKVTSNKVFYSKENSGEIDLSLYDCVIDAIDTVSSKIELIVRAKAAGVHIICSMGAGNKLDPTLFTVTDIFKTETDPLAKAIRKELRALGLKDVPVVWSKEPPHATANSGPVPSNAFVPPTAGLILAAETVKHLTSK